MVEPASPSGEHVQILVGFEMCQPVTGKAIPLFTLHLDDEFPDLRELDVTNRRYSGQQSLIVKPRTIRIPNEHYRCLLGVTPNAFPEMHSISGQLRT